MGQWSLAGDTMQRQTKILKGSRVPDYIQCAERGMNIRQAADHCGVDPNTVWKAKVRHGIAFKRKTPKRKAKRIVAE